MPIWLVAIGMWAKKNPLQTAQLIAVAALAGLAVWFYFDYTGTKRENAALEKRVEQAETNYKAATVRIDEFVAAQDQFEADLEALRETSVAIRGQVRTALKDLKAAEIEREFRNNPVEAEVGLNRRLSHLFGLFDDVTRNAPVTETTDPALTRPH